MPDSQAHHVGKEKLDRSLGRAEVKGIWDDRTSLGIAIKMQIWKPAPGVSYVIWGKFLNLLHLICTNGNNITLS